MLFENINKEIPTLIVVKQMNSRSKTNEHFPHSRSQIFSFSSDKDLCGNLRKIIFSGKKAEF